MVDETNQEEQTQESSVNVQDQQEVVTSTTEEVNPGAYDNALSIYADFSATAIHAHEGDFGSPEMRDKFKDLDDDEYNYLSLKFQKEYPTSPTIHTVSQGETLGGIANNYGVYQADLESENNMGTELQTGQQITVGGTNALQTSRAKKTRDNNYTQHIKDNVDPTSMRDVIGWVESGSSKEVQQDKKDPYSLKPNKYGAMGKYQIKFGDMSKEAKAALKDKGFDIKNNRQFLKNPKAQDALMDYFLTDEYPAQVKELRRKHKKSTTGYSDFDLMMSIHKLGYTKADKKLSKGKFSVGSVKGVKGTQIDLEAGAYINKGKGYIKEQGYENVLFSSEDRFYSGDDYEQIMLHSDPTNPLVRKLNNDKATKTAVEQTKRSFKAVGKWGGVIELEKQPTRAMTAEERLVEAKEILYDQALNNFYDVAGEKLQATFLNRHFPEGSTTDVLATEWSKINSDMFDVALSHLEEFSKTSLFTGMEEDFSFEIPRTEEEADVQGELMEGEDKTVRVVGKRMYGLSERMTDALKGLVHSRIANSLEGSILPGITGELNYENFNEDNAATRERQDEVDGTFDAMSRSMAMGNSQFGRSAVAGYATSRPEEKTYYKYALELLDKKYDDDVVPPVYKEGLALQAAEKHWWETSGAKQDHEAQMEKYLEGTGIVNPEVGLAAATEMFYSIKDDKGIPPYRAAEMMNKAAQGTYTFTTAIKANGTYGLTAVENVQNRNSFAKISNRIHKDVEAKYPHESLIESSFEYVVKESMNKNSIGLMYRALTGHDFFDTYGYNPTESEEFMSEVGAFVFDPVFIAGGAVFSGALKLGTKIGTKYAFNSGTRGLAYFETKYGTESAKKVYDLYSSTVMNSTKYNTLNKVSSGAGGFAAFDSYQDVMSQYNELGSFLEVDYAQTLNQGGNGALLGASVASVGIGFNRYRGLLSKRGTPEYKQLWTRPVEFTTEVGVFTAGGSALHGEPLTWQSFEDGGKFMFGLKLTHGAMGARKSFAKRFENFNKTGSIWTPAKSKSRFDIVGLKESDRRILAEELGLPKDATSEQIFEVGFGKADKLSTLIGNENVSQNLHDKIMYISTGSMVNIHHRNGQYNAEAVNSRVITQVTQETRVNPETGQKEYIVSTKNAKGEVVDVDIFGKEAEAVEAAGLLDNAMWKNQAADQFSMLKSYSASDLNKIFQENGVTQDYVLRILDKDRTTLSAEVSSLIDKVVVEAYTKNLEHNNRIKLENRDLFAKSEEAPRMQDGDPALYGQYLQMQKEGKEMTSEQKADFERIDAVKDKQLDKTYEEVMGEPRVVEVKPDVEVKPEVAPEKTEVFHGSDSKIIEIDPTKFEGEREMGIHVGSEKAATDRITKKLEGKGETTQMELTPGETLKVERDFVWEGNEAAEGIIKEKGYKEYKKEVDANKELGIESDYFGDYLVDNKILTPEQVEANPTPQGLRKALLEKGYKVIEYKNQAEDAGKSSYLVLDPANIGIKGAKPKSEAQLEADAIKDATVPAVETKQPKLSSDKTTFTQELDKAKSQDPEAYWSVDKVEASDLKSGKLIEVEGGYGVVSKDGEIKGVFKTAGSKAKGVGDNVIQEAVAEGGRKLDNFDGYLTGIYEKNGFKVAGRTSFSEQFAPEGWNKDKHGTPDVVGMVYDPQNKLNIKEKKFSSYEEMIAYRNSLAEASQKAYPTLTEKQKTRNKFNNRVKTIRQEYTNKISEVKGDIKAERQALNDVKTNLTNIIKETEFKAPIKKSLLKQAVNIKTEKGIEKFVDAVENANHRQEVRNRYEDINSLKRSVERKIANGELASGITKGAVQDLLNLDFKSLETSLGTKEGSEGVKVLEELAEVYEQLARPRVPAVTGKSAPEAIVKLNERANALIKRAKEIQEGEVVSDNTSAEALVAKLNERVEAVSGKAEEFEFDFDNLTGSEKRRFANTMRGLRDGKNKLEQSLNDGLITPEVYKEQMARIDEMSEAMGEKRTKYIEGQHTEAVGYLKTVLENRSEYPEYSDAQIEMIERLVKSGRIEGIGWTEDLHVSALDIASGYFPTNRIGGLIKDVSAFENGNALYKQINTGLELKGETESKGTAPELAKEMGKDLTSFMAQRANAEGTGTTLDTRVVAPNNRAMSEASKAVDNTMHAFNKVSGKYNILQLDYARDKKMTKLGMIMQMAQHEMNGGKGDVVYESLFNEKNSKNYQNKKQVEWMQEIYSNLPKKEVDGKQVIDWNKAYETLSGSEKKIYDFVREKYDRELKDKQKFINEYRGIEFQDFNHYLPIYRHGAGEISATDMGWAESMFNQGNTKIQADAGKMRTSSEFGAFEYNLEKIFSRSIVETNRDFHMTPVVGESSSIINQAIRVAQENGSNNTETYLSAYKRRLEDGLKLHFDTSPFHDRKAQKAIQTMSGAAYAAALVRPWRVGIEYLTESYRVGVGASTKESANVFMQEHVDRLRVSYDKLASLPSAVRSAVKGEGFELAKTQRVSNDLLEFTKSPYFQRFNKFSIEGDYDILGSISQQGIVKSLSNYAMSAPDRATVHLAWMPNFQSEFKRITGDNFNRKEFRDNPEYRKLYKDEIFDAGAIADREAGKWKNAAIKGQGRTHIRIPFGSIETVKSKTLTPIVTYMSSFAALESAQFTKSLQRTVFGDSHRGRGEAAKASFAQFSAGVGYATLTGAEYMYGKYVIAGQIGNNEERERQQNQIRQEFNNMYSPEGILKNVQGNAAFLATGRYGQLGRTMMLLSAGLTQNLIGDEAKVKDVLPDFAEGFTGDATISEWVEEFTNRAYLDRPMNLQKYGKKSETISDLLPMVGYALELVQNNIDGIQTVIEARASGDKRFIQPQNREDAALFDMIVQFSNLLLLTQGTQIPFTKEINMLSVEGVSPVLEGIGVDYERRKKSLEGSKYYYDTGN